MPTVTVTAHILPIAIVVEVFDARNDVRHILVADITIVWIVVIRIVQVGVVVTITPVVERRILIAVVVVQEISGVIRIEARQHDIRSSLPDERQHFASTDLPASGEADHLRQSA